MDRQYPKFIINLPYLSENVAEVKTRCREQGIEIAGIIKGINAVPQVAKAYEEGGVEVLGTSRLEQIRLIKEYGVKTPMMYIRIPMLSEIEEMVELCEISLASEIEVLKAVNEEAARQGKIHKIMLMQDVGDLREGFFIVDELVEAARMIEFELDNLHLWGVGTNVGCYGALEPTVETLSKVADAACEIEKAIGRELEIVCGGGSSSLMRVWDRNMPPKINYLRAGGEIMLAYTNQVVYGYDESFLHSDAFQLEAEIVEVKRKPDKEGNLRKCALIGLGTADYCHLDGLHHRDPGVKLLSGFQDYTLLDIEEAQVDYKVGDIVRFDLSYSGMVYLAKSPGVKLEFIDK